MMKEGFFQPEISSRRDFVHRLVGEFRETFDESGYEVPEQTDGVVVLSAAPIVENDQTIENSPQNISRITCGIEVAKKIAAISLDKSIEELTIEDIVQAAPSLILDGETEQLPMMQEIALSLGFPEEKITLINSGDRGVSNTKTQLQAISKNPQFKESEHLTLITSDYHLPRVTRAGMAQLDKNLTIEVIGATCSDDEKSAISHFDVYRLVRGEIRRIIDYSENGDLKKDIADPASPLLKFGADIRNVEIDHQADFVQLPEPIATLREALVKNFQEREATGENVPTDGDLVNVASISFENGVLRLVTNKTTYFSYLAASSYYRGDHSENPIRPLAVSLSLRAADGSIFYEKRPESVSEMQGKNHVFGGSIRPSESSDQAIKRILESKLGISAKEGSIKTTGVDIENLQNICEVFCVVDISDEQIETLKSLKGEHLRSFNTSISIDQIGKKLEADDFTDWNPSGLLNLMYALVYVGYETPREMDATFQRLLKKVHHKPYRYNYPLENFLSKE